MSSLSSAFCRYRRTVSSLGVLLGLSFLICILHTAPAHAQSVTLRGFVTDASDGEPLQGVNIVLDNEAGVFLGAATDGDGVYVISRIPPGRYQLRASFIGYETYVDTLTLDENELRTINIALRADEAELNEVLVESERESGAARVRAGLQTVRPGDIERVPTPDIAGDLASYLTTMPGVVSLGDRGGQLFIRGGEPAHNMVLLDGMYVHQPFHMLGFYSAFPSAIINQADVYSAGYGAPYTGRIASVIDIQARNGNKRGYAGAASVAPFVSTLRLEGPVIKNHLSFLGSFRQSIIEEGADRYIKQPLPYDFGDFFGKLHLTANTNHQLSFSVLRTHDRGTLGPETPDQALDEIRWNNEAYGARYLVLPQRVPFVAEILLSFSRLRSELGPDEAPTRFAEFDGFNYALNITHFSRNAEWKWGLFWRDPEISSLLGGIYQNVEFGFGRRHKAGVYIEPNFYITETLRARIGLIGQIFPNQDELTFVEPRARLVWAPGRHEVSGAFGLYHQEVVGLNDRRDATNVFTAWRSAPTTDLSRATHALLGYRYTPTPWLELSVEGYYKHLSNLFISEWTSFPRFTTRLQPADGRVAGLDVRVEVRRPWFYGFINYGLSSVRYEAKQATLELWYGTETLDFRPPHDRRHQVNALASTSLYGFDVSVRWNFGSGRPYNRLYGFDGFVLMHGVRNLFDTPDEQRVIYERPFRGLLPTYHRLDVSVERRFDLGAVDLTAQASFINVYDRRNLFALDLFTQRRTDQLPFIPTLGLKMEFQ